MTVGIWEKNVMKNGDKPARARKNDRFHQKLEDNVAFFGAERAPDADFPRAFGHAGEHDVHDPDAAHEERDARDGPKHDIEDALGFLGAPHQFKRHRDRVIVLRVVHR
jgi:hypothetical protein